MVIKIELLLLLVFLLCLYFAYKTCKSYKNTIQKKFKDMDVYFSRRYNLIAELLENTKNAMEPVGNIIIKMKELIKYDYSILTKDEKLKLNGRITTGLKKLFQVSIADGQMQVEKDYYEIRKKIEDIQDCIEKTSKEYNSSVEMYNKYLASFPKGIFASALGFNFEKKYENFSHKTKSDDE